jgi:hypothetical protein
MSCLTHGCPPPAPGSRRSHCAACHQTFSGLTAFDRHQTLDRTRTGYPVICLPPTEFTNLIQRPDGVWRLPGEVPDGVFPLSGDDRDGRTPQTLGAGEGQATTEAHGAAQ